MHSIWFRRFAPRLLIGTALAAVLIAVGIYPRINQNALHVLCANNYHSCSALAAEYEKLSGENVQFVRLPTSQALEKLAANPELPEFDVFIGGPAEAYEQARISGLIQPHRLHDLPDSRFATAYWIGTYGGILAFCINPQHTNIENAPQQWQDLTKPEFKRKIVLPSPLTSGTAGTMLGTLNSRFPNRADFRKYLQSLHANALTYTDSGTHLANLIAADRAQIAVTFAPYCESYPHRRLKVIFPADGTGYEIGAAAIVRGGNFKAAQDFLRFAVSDRGQALVASIENQNPISANLPNNLSVSLKKLNVPIYDGNAARAGANRETLIHLFAREVLYG